MVQKFQHCSLHFSVSWLVVIESLCTNCINFVNKNDCWRFFFCKGECISDHLRTITDVHLDKSWSGKFQESGFSLSSTGSGHHGFSSTWRSKHEAAFWRSDTNVVEFLFVSDGQDDGFSQFFDLLVEATNIGVFFWWSFFDFHGSDSWVILSWELFEENIRIFIYADKFSRSE